MKEIFTPTAQKYEGALSFSPNTKRICAGTDVPYRWYIFRHGFFAEHFDRAIMLLEAKY